MKQKSVDVVILGGGTAGLSALREVRKKTENFVIINEGPWGTTCARVGCMPSKAMIEAANAFHLRVKMESFGIRGADQLRIDLPAVLDRVRSLRDDFVKGTTKATADLDQRAISGRARFLEADEVLVNDCRIRAKAIIIATGSCPALPDSWQRFEHRILTSEYLFEQQDLPSRIAVIGLGPIGAELGQAFSRLGVQVDGFTRSGRVAGITDPKVLDTFVELLQAEFPIHRDTSVELVEDDDGFRVVSGDDQFPTDKVLVAIGRRPNIDGLGLEKIGIPLDSEGSLPFDPQTMQVADLPIFFAGDVNGRAPILHEASDDGHIAGRNALISDPQCHQRRTRLSIVFTDPNVAVIGQRYSDLNQSDAVVGEVRFDRQGRARTAERNKGLLRVYAQKSSGQLLGCELCAPGGEHLAHLLALAIQQQLSVQDLLRMPFYHPVLEEGLRTALRHLASQLPETHSSDLACCEALDIETIESL